MKLLAAGSDTVYAFRCVLLAPCLTGFLSHVCNFQLDLRCHEYGLSMGRLQCQKSGFMIYIHRTNFLANGRTNFLDVCKKIFFC